MTFGQLNISICLEKYRLLQSPNYIRQAFLYKSTDIFAECVGTASNVENISNE